MTTVESAEDLKLQFDKLQQKQQEKLARRKQKKLAESTKKGGKETAKSVTFGVNDDLDLKLSEPPSNSGSIYSEELVLHLNDQIREMKDENGRLYKLLSERDFELRKLRKKQEVAAFTGLPPGGIAAEAASSKIVELSKKVRELTAELETERTKVKQMAKKCLDLQKEAVTTTSPSSGNSTYRRKDPSTNERVGEDEVKTLQEKLRQAELKSTEYRNQTQALRQDLRLAQKVLVQEVGEGSTVQSLLAASSGWRGRAQQIITLQKKVNDLKSQLGVQQRSNSTGTSELDDELFGTTRSAKRMSAIEQHKEQIRKAEKERREAQERMAAQMKALEQDYETQKDKLEAAKSRNKVLQTESKATKQQIETLLEKGRHDDELIQALFKQQNKLKEMLDETATNQRQSENNRQEALKQLSQRSQQENNIIEQLQRIVDEKEVKIRTLLEQLQQMQNAVGHGMQQNPVTFEWGPPSSRGDSRQETSVTQTPGAAWTSPPPPLSSRESTAMSRHNSVDAHSGPPSARQLSSRQQSRSGSSLAGSRPGTASVLEPMEELHIQCQEYKLLCQASQVERDKLTELVQLIQARLDAANGQVTEAQAELISQRRKNALLEKQIGKARIDQAHSSAQKGRNNTSKSSATLRDSLEFGGDSLMNLEELQVSLEIQQDENEALKVVLQRTLAAKEEDKQLYSEMMEETKRVFLQGLRQYKQKQQGMS
ncbi:hypothetical protein NP493_181g00044 [Ridgeia piscesae]|uniref:Coiled-coil domain-containing protein 13 n=1 Tax=Ridgeia piscesae TaxID=27915 RepID=A0AAD9UF38_RIDPI|nr:hypothetical protein NP493_181g00044 [Ridgeia piscesae]